MFPVFVFWQRHHPTHWGWARTAAAKAPLLRGAIVRNRSAAAMLMRTFPGRRVEVAGESMLPLLQPGDRVVVAPAGRLRVGDVVAGRDPRAPARILVKRVAAVGPAGVDLRGDNVHASTDSRTFGPVPPGAVLGRVIYRYAPASRVGWLRRPSADPKPEPPGGPISAPAGSSPARSCPGGPSTPRR